jgi:hypothetical protein
MNLDVLPLWGFFFGTIAVILLSVEAGFALGKQAARRSQNEKEAPAAAIGGAVLGLVAFMLAFTFSIASGRFDARKELVRDDAGAIRTAWLRADFLAEPERGEIKKLLSEYLDVRVAIAESKDLTRVPAAQATSTAIQRRLWEYAVANGKKDLNSDIGALLVESINEVINVHAVRMAVAVDTRIPSGIWIVLYALSVLGMLAMGYHTAISGSMRSRAGIILAVSFALVITLIAGLDRPDTPFVSVTQKPLRDLQRFMEQPPPPPPPNRPAAERP